MGLFSVLSSLTICLLLRYSAAKSRKNCEPLYDSIFANDQVYSIEWKDTPKQFYSLVISNPPCLDAHNNYVLKICENGTWYPKHRENCFSVLTNQLCPNKFKNADKNCIFLSEPQQFSSKCPIPGGSYTDLDIDKKMWYDVEKSSLFGPHEYVFPGKNYGLPEKKLNHEDENCTTIFQKEIQPTSCSSMYNRICKYKFNHFLYQCPHNCVPGGLGSNYCFCKIVSARTKPRSQFCEKLATPKYVYEMRTLEKLAEGDICWIENIVNYTKNALLNTAINEDGLSLQENSSLNCAICQIYAQIGDNPELVLKFDAKNEELYLLVYHPESLFETDDEIVYCFTDAGIELKTRVDVEEEWDSSFNAFQKEQQKSLQRYMKVFKVEVEQHVLASYWCEAFKLPQVVLIKSNTIIAYSDFQGHEYSLRITIKDVTQSKLHETLAGSIYEKAKSIFSLKPLKIITENVRPMKIFKYDPVTREVDVLLHVTTKKSNKHVMGEYHQLNNVLRSFSNSSNNFSVVYFKSSEFCLKNTTMSDFIVLEWPLTPIGTVKASLNLCIDNKGYPVARKCGGDFLYGANWLKPHGTCNDSMQFSNKTKYLHYIYSTSVNETEIQNLPQLVYDTSDLTVLDIYYIAEVLIKTSENEFETDLYKNYTIDVINDVMNSAGVLLQNSQTLLNSTDEILDAFEKIVDKINSKTTKNLWVLRRNNFIIHSSKPFHNNISGLALYDCQNDQVSACQLNHVFLNSTPMDLMVKDDFVLGTFVPETLLDQLSQNMTIEQKHNLTVITTVFCKDTLFNSQKNESKKVGNKVVSITIPGYGIFLPSPINILFSSSGNGDRECAYWSFGRESQNRSGYWLPKTSNYLETINSSWSLCSFDHLTHFALLVMNMRLEVSDDATSVENFYDERRHDHILSIVTAVGCLLSLLGILGIFLTAVLFQNWREKVGNKILLQLSLSISLEIVLIYVSDNYVQEHLSACTIVGVVLHYAVLSKFCWMLVSAILQFLRFVQVLGPMPKHIMLKAVVVGWGFPLIPVSFVAGLDPGSYISHNAVLCYPQDLGLYLGVILPIVVIIGLNSYIFIKVMLNIFHLKAETQRKSRSLLKRQLCQAILLSSLLGIPWIFGVILTILSSISFTKYFLMYLLCLTATVQGFILFLFYIVLDKNTRTAWRGFYNNRIRVLFSK